MKKILIIDDDLGIVEALRAILEIGGYQVTSADNGEYVYKLEKKDLPDLILLDLLLSGSDGRSITKKLKHTDGLKKIPIIMLSAHPSAEKAAKDAGADDFVAKPFDMDHLLQTIAKHTNH